MTGQSEASARQTQACALARSRTANIQLLRVGCCDAAPRRFAVHPCQEEVAEKRIVNQRLNDRAGKARVAHVAQPPQPEPTAPVRADKTCSARAQQFSRQVSWCPRTSKGEDGTCLLQRQVAERMIQGGKSAVQLQRPARTRVRVFCLLLVVFNV
jgi:hypothetical protein